MYRKSIWSNVSHQRNVQRICTSDQAMSKILLWLFCTAWFFSWVGWKKQATQWSLCCTVTFVWHEYLERLDAGQRTEWLHGTKEFQYYWLGILHLLFEYNTLIVGYNSTFFSITLLLPSTNNNKMINQFSE